MQELQLVTHRPANRTPVMQVCLRRLRCLNRGLGLGTDKQALFEEFKNQEKTQQLKYGSSDSEAGQGCPQAVVLV